MVSKMFIFPANIEKNVILRCHLDGAALHLHLKKSRRVQKVASPVRSREPTCQYYQGRVQKAASRDSWLRTGEATFCTRPW